MLSSRQSTAPCGVVGWLIAVGLCGCLFSAGASAESPTADRLPSTLAPLLAKVLPAVVSIRVIGQRYLVTELKPAVPPAKPKTQPFKAAGSGVIFDAEQGLVGTNHHVVKDAIAISVGLHDGRSALAKLVGKDIGTDIAILKIDLPELTALTLGNSDNVAIGDFVVAVGNPYGLEGTATAGIVSGLMRSEVGYEIFESFIQTDAAVNPGNSGGALVNLDGDLIGINTAIAGGGSNIGIGFAIPINMARRIGRQILLHGRMPRGSVGLTTQDIEPNAARSMRRTGGAMISGVEPNSPAQTAGLGVGQVVVGIDGERIRTHADYMARLGSSAIGDTLELAVADENSTRKVKLTVADLKTAPATVIVPHEFKGMGGLVVASIGPGSPLYGELRGVTVQRIESQSPAESAGFQVDDVIVAINQESIADVSQIAQLVQADAKVDRVQISRSNIPYLLQLSQ
jgi:S1-C subfamily serine protease